MFKSHKGERLVLLKATKGRHQGMPWAAKGKLWFPMSVRTSGGCQEW